MKHFNIFLFISLNLFLQACAQKQMPVKQPEAENIINYNRLEKVRTTKPEGEINYVKGLKGEKTVFKVITKEQPKFIFYLSTAIPLVKKSYPKGQVFLLSFDAKTTKSSLETGEAKVLWKFRQTGKHKADINTTISIGSDWQTYYIPLQADRDIAAQNLGLVMQFGFKPQEFLIKNLRLLAYPQNTTISDLPKTKITYQGMEADAQWRKDALKRIEQIRKTPFKLTFVHNGNPISDKSVEIQQIKHEFPFGAAITAKDILNNTLAFKKLKSDFNLVVFENDMKIRQWQNPTKKALTLKASNILNAENIKIKGHVLVWPGYNYMPKKLKEQIGNDPDKLIRIVHNHLTDILTATKGKINYWDVVNEAYTNRDFQKLTGSEDLLYEAFKYVKRIQPEAKRFTNEYGIISKGGIDKTKQEWYYNFIKRLDQNTDGLVDGIGIQSHIGSDLTPPEKVLQILDYYGQLNKDISISEFTMDVTDPEIREKYTRDFMIAAFSHPKVSQFLFWGLVDNHKKKVDIYQQDAKPGAMGKAYLYLTKKLWHTSFKANTDSKGSIENKGFFGTYQYKIKIDGKEYKGFFKLSKGKEKKLLIKI